jgi:homoserine kinase type II
VSNQTQVDGQVVLDAWRLPPPYTLRAAEAGTNNLSRVVETPAGAYFLRIYQNTADTLRVRFEHAVLLQLQEADLPFAVPCPLATRHGETYAVVVQGGDERKEAGGRAIAALFPLIAGRHPRRGDAAQALSCGEALALLDRALALVEVDPALPPLPAYGDLDHVHAQVPDPLAMLADVPLSAAAHARLHALIAALRAQIPDLYVHLPRQIIHGDYGRSNVLLEHERVSGILDFEITLPDIRALDITCAIWSFGIAPWQTERDWAPIEAIATGYGRRCVLTDLEVAALPALARLREAASLIHWAGRLRRGLTTADDVAGRARAMLHVDDWLQVYGAALVQRVARAMG